VLSKQGYQCSVCKGPYHPECKVKAKECPGLDFYKDMKKDKEKKEDSEKVVCASRGPRTDLHWACDRKEVTKVRELVASLEKEQINSGDAFRQTPLHVACQVPFPEGVKIILESGKIEINLRNDEESSPLHMIALKADGEEVLSIAKLLLDHNALIDAKNDRGTTPLQLACAKGNPALVKLLLERKASLRAVGELGTALHCAAYFGNKQIVELLLQARADISQVDEDGKTATQVAKEKGQNEIVTLLLESEKREEISDTD